MNIFNSGKIPEKLKKLLAVAAVLSVLCTGCSPSEPISLESGEPGYTSYDDESHIPTEESSDDVTDSTYSADVTESSKASSETPSGSSAVSGSSSATVSSDVSDSRTENSSVQSAESSAVSSQYSSTSAESSVPVSSSSATSETSVPIPVVIPDMAIPTSPGTDCEVNEKGVIDFSNASFGYVSAKYTGSVSKIKFRITVGGKDYDYDLTPNKTEYFPLSEGSGNYTVTIFENTSGTKYTRAVERKNFPVSISNSLSPFLYPNQYSTYNSSSACVYKAAEVCAGKTGDIEKIAAVFTWITDNVSYDYALADSVKAGSTKTYVPNPDKTYNSRKGICFDYASLMCAMLRSQGIPTRLVKGNASPDIWHAWNEVYTAETGWITPELLFKNAGYNLADSTFYASASDKAKIASYISNSGNYTPAYYY